MKTLIKKASIIPFSNDEKNDILIIDGIIKEISPSISKTADHTIEGENIIVSIGLCDLENYGGEPGLEEREDLESLAKSAKAGGFTHIGYMPNTSPALDKLSLVKYFYDKKKLDLKIQVIPAATLDADSNNITEMYDMNSLGIKAFSNGKNPIQHTGAMLRVLQYVKPFGGVIMNRPLESYTSKSGMMHEGAISTSLGLKGIPSISEVLMLERDIELLAYTQSRLHVLGLSTEEGVNLVRNAKERGLHITASVNIMNLCYTDEALLDFDTNFKLLPPLREKTDQAALIEGIKDGTIDCITSAHTPYDVESKDLEFAFAKFGAATNEAAFGKGYEVLKDHITLKKYLSLWTAAPRKILGLAVPEIVEGAAADLTIFSIKNITYEQFYTKGKNTPFLWETAPIELIDTVLYSER